jgi:hypothetical protein
VNTRAGLSCTLRLAFGGFEFRFYLVREPFVASQPEHVLHAVRLAPVHEIVTAEAAIGTDDDGGCGPMSADVVHNAGNLFGRSIGSVVRRGPGLGCQQMPAAEDIQWQKAIAVVVAVEVPTFLIAVERIIGGIQVDDDAQRGFAMGLDEQIYEQLLDGGCIVVGLIVAILTDLGGIFQPVQCRLAGNRTARLVNDGCKRRIAPQRIVVDEIFIAERKSAEALAQQVRERVHDGLRNTVVREASRQPLGELQLPVGTGEQRHTAIRRDRDAIEGAHKFASAGPSQIKLGLDTLCRHRGTSPSQIKSFSQNNFL